MTFNAREAKPGSKWRTRGGYTLTFERYVPNASPDSRAEFSDDHTTYENGRYLGMQFNSIGDIIGPAEDGE